MGAAVLGALALAGCGSGNSGPGGAPTPTPGGTPTPPQSRVAFVSDRDGQPQIYLINGDGTEQKRLASGTIRESGPALSLDGSKIAFSRYGSGINDVFIMNPDGSDLRNVTNNTSPGFTGYGSPSLNRDGSIIAYSMGEAHSRSVGTIFVTQADGSSKSNGGARSPSLSPDGSRVAFASACYPCNYNDLKLANTDGSGSINLSDAGTDDVVTTAFDPSGTRIAFSRRSSAPKGGGIFIIDIATRQETRLTNGAANDSHPSFSPDGTKIAFQSDRDGTTQIYQMNANGSNIKKLTSVGNNSDPSWGGPGS